MSRPEGHSRVQLVVPDLSDGKKESTLSRLQSWFVKPDATLPLKKRVISRNPHSQATTAELAWSGGLFVPIRTPAQISDFDCLGIHASGSDLPAQFDIIPNPDSCSSASLSSLRRPGRVLGLVPITGGSVSLDAPLGSVLTLQLFGLNTSDGSCPSAEQMASDLATFSSALENNAASFGSVLESDIRLFGVPFELANSALTISEDTTITLRPELAATALKPVFCDGSAALLPSLRFSTLTLGSSSFDLTQDLPDLSRGYVNASLRLTLLADYQSHIQTYAGSSALSLQGATLESGPTETAPGVQSWNLLITDLDAFSVALQAASATDLYGRASLAAAQSPVAELKARLTSAGYGSYIPPSVSRSLLSQSATTVATGSQITVTLTGYDDQNTRTEQGGETVTFSLAAASGASTGSFGAVTDHGDGTYSAIFTGGIIGTSAMVRAAINGVTVASTGQIQVISSGAASLAFTTYITAALVAGQPLSLTVAALDQSGQIDSAYNGAISLSVVAANNSPTLAGTTTVNAIAGVASFANVSLSGAGSSISLRASGPSVSSVTGSTFNIGAGTPSVAHSTLAVSASTLTAGSSTTVTLTSKNQYGIAITTDPSLTVTFIHNGGTSAGTFASVNNVGDGTYTATFTGTTSGTATDIRAYIDAVLVTSTAAMTVNPGPVSLAKSTLAVSSATIASNGTSTVTLTARDANSNLLTGLNVNTIALNLSTGLGVSTGSFSTPIVNVGDGTYTATFTGGGSGTATTIGATIGGSAVTNNGAALPTITVNPAAATKLAITTQPSSSYTAGGAIIVGVSALNANDNVDTSYTANITLSFGNDASGGTATLGGTKTVAAVAGVASFTTLNVDKAFSGYTISASAPGLTGATTSAFNITPGSYTLAQSSVSSASSTVSVGSTTSLTVTLRDVLGNTVYSPDLAITFTLSGGTSTGNFSAANYLAETGAYSATFTGTAAGTATSVIGRINATSDITGGAASITVIPAPVFTWDRILYDFGSYAAGESSGNVTFRLSNSGSAASGCSAVALTTSPSPIQIVSQTCGTSDLAANSSCTVTLAAVPTATGASSNQLQRTCTVGGTTYTTSQGLTVTGVASTNTAAWKPASYSFGNVVVGRQSHTTKLFFQNTGNSTLTGCSTVSQSNPARFTITSDSCGTSNLPVNGICEIQIQATAATATSYSTNLSRTCTSGGVANITVSVTANTPTPTQISAGTSHSCARLSSGGVQCWGYNVAGQLGNETTTSSATPVNTTSIDTATSVMAGYSHSCALLSGGTVRCWGDNTYGQIGNGNTGGSMSTPTQVVSLSGVSLLAVGDNFNCAKDASYIKCWGQNSQGQLGTAVSVGYGAHTPTTLNGVTAAHVTALAAGAAHACAILTDQSVQSVRCWGANTYGQLGDGTQTQSATPVAVTLAGGSTLTGVTALALGVDHSCALKTNGSVYCWGAAYLGDGSSSNSSRAVAVSGISGESPASAISAGGYHTCAILPSNGSLKCWGKNSSGQLGTGDGLNKSVATDAASGLTFTQLDLGAYYSCGLLSGSQGVRCWGANPWGQLGNGKQDILKVRAAVTGLSNVTDLSAGASSTCAVASGNPQCWGGNQVNQLGIDATGSYFAPSALTGLANVTQVAAAQSGHGCALKSDGTVNCWGLNTYGQVGDGTTTTRSTPVAVTLAGTATQVVNGANFSCALLSTGSVQCWGLGTSGQLGNGSGASATSPVTVSGITTATTLAAGGSHACAVLQDKTIQCWGADDHGQIEGIFGYSQKNSPFSISNISNAMGLAAGDDFTCYLATSGSVGCWGYNGKGQLGRGMVSTTSYTPATVNNVQSAIAISANTSGACALLSTGTLKCWGDNTYAQLGNGDASAPPTGQAACVIGIYTASQVSAGKYHSAARLSDGSVVSWGKDEYGATGSRAALDFPAVSGY